MRANISTENVKFLSNLVEIGLNCFIFLSKWLRLLYISQTLKVLDLQIIMESAPFKAHINLA